ncbi:sterol carrier protein [Amycolatopsis sp. K13G38]|uniref:Sterol carrier protein n=1 Tax=Amycolatopsis acididurans TaxID=2724524 RepID=A0ABX1J395_9PSEU|nr:sterol carrier protein [Amycolatopsis acididurans]NKQ54223.1 sterol carrier protein [Amycolatopsis acididurans]
MMPLSCAAEIDRYIGGTVRSAFRDPQAGPMLAGRRMRVRLGFVEPDCVLDIDTERREVHLGGAGDAEPSALVAMSADTANMWCQGRLDLRSAMANGEVAAAGRTEELLELLSAASWLPRLYVGELKRAGRQDLLVF